MGLMSSRDIQLSNLFYHELAPVLTSMFDDEEEMRIRNVHKPDAVLIDACAILWSIHWPIHGTVHDYFAGFRNDLLHKLAEK